MAVAADVLEHASAVLAEYGHRGATLVPLANAGGFSGACIFRAATARGDLCLRAWPSNVEASRVESIHRLMARGRCLVFMPRVERTIRGSTIVTRGERVWDAQTWMPGAADFHRFPSVARVEAACRSLALLHSVWPREPVPQPCPAVRRRFEALDAWTRLWQDGWRPEIRDADPVAEPARAALGLLPDALARIPQALAPWASRPVPLQPCLCDVWHDHVLFTGDEVTGIIDYGSVKRDHVAVDLARLLGSLVAADDAMRRAGLTAYRSVRPLSAQEEELVALLDETGLVLGIANWLRWLFHENRVYDDRSAVVARLSELVQRLPRLGLAKGPHFSASFS